MPLLKVRPMPLAKPDKTGFHAKTTSRRFQLVNFRWISGFVNHIDPAAAVAVHFNAPAKVRQLSAQKLMPFPHNRP
jgi:hypothetical protein